MISSNFWQKRIDKLSESLGAKNPTYDKWKREVLDNWVKHSKSTKSLPVNESKVVYSAEDSAISQGDLPGEYPFTRGIYPNMYRGRLWTMRMFAGYGTPEDTNRRLKYLLKHGETGLSIAFDEPTLYGIDCNDERAVGEVGRCGVNVTTLKDMEVLFDGIPLDSVSTSMTINAPAIILFAMYIAVAKKQKVPVSALAGTVQADILKEYIAQKEWLYPPEAHLRMIRDMVVFSTKKMPRWNYISVSGYHIREAGATAAQELAFTLADGFHYIDLGMEAGLKVDEFAPRMSFFFDSSINMFEEIAKFRAARRIWANVLKEKYKARDPHSLKLRFHTQTSGYTLTWQQPLNNIIRTTTEALSAVLGGTQSLHTNSYDEALALPTEEAAKIALRTQQIIAYETGAAEVADPLGGSYYLENLTSRIELEAYEYFDKIEKLGGMLNAVKEGYPQKEIANSAYERQQRLEGGEDVMVGVNAYREENEKPINILRIDRKPEFVQKKRLGTVMSRRNQKKVNHALNRLRSAMNNERTNLVPYIMDAVVAYATLGEIANVGKEIYGEWKEPKIL